MRRAPGRAAFLVTAPALLLAAALAAAAPAGVFREWNTVEKLIGESAIPPAEARRRLEALHPRLVEASARGNAGGTRHFPVRGYGLRDVGGKNGSGYAPAGYDYYEGKHHTGHPAHDIFIHDRDQDSRDDATGRPVEVISFSDGVVAASNPSWDPVSGTRGGKAVWVFDPSTDSFYCYAHLSGVSVEPGALVRAGDVLGAVGRSGKNAAPRRSPTHLHFMRLDFAGGRMTPRDTWTELRNAARSR